MSRSQSSPITTEVVKEVAEQENVEPVELPPLYNAVDPASLEDLFDSSNSDVQVTFSYLEYQITVSDSGSIEVSLTQ
ncbi:hypothetical protein JMJ58_19360 [Haloterrigena salifodinae]|uniref:Halobacterial output domain-containing protein n=1 Tax=Haloterrigena salifodinae TaxID=2675099 RepID=A0A8T8E0U1_9EURY|nr:HalOD1 output domain-containing protein [Haloterrigena salifodinae]QRV15040.1 hypothetical protein JMJ58_19360 [Haloterrigena salifodinae]